MERVAHIMEWMGVATCMGLAIHFGIVRPAGAENQAPVARAVARPSRGCVNTRFVLDGRLSYDPDGDSLTFRWEQVGGPAVELRDYRPDRYVSPDTLPAKAYEPMGALFLAADPGRYVFSLVVHDPSRDSQPAEVVISVVSGDEAVQFGDENLQRAIRRMVGKPAGEILQSDVAWFVELDVIRAPIADLSGIEHCLSLKALELNGKQVSDLSPLSGLTRLERMELGSNQVRDVRPLAGLIWLVSLNLGRNRIGDISALSGLTYLQQLSLWGNQISDVRALSGLKRLEILSLFDNQIPDVSALSGLRQLRVLSLSRNQISDLSPLAGLSNLEKLHLDDNLITDISPLVENLGIGRGDRVDLWGNPLSEEAFNVQVGALRERGVEVSLERPVPTAGKCKLP